MGIDIKDFTNHSGGAEGADMTWDKMGRKHGFENHIHWRPEHLSNLTPEGHRDMIRAFTDAAKALGRPTVFRGVELAQRNWLQAHHAYAIYAVARIINPGEFDGTPTRHFKNNTGKQVVSGGTGWAVEMAIQMNKTVYVFNMNDNQWYVWNYHNKEFWPTFIPYLTESYAGIGSRNLTKMGEKAIEEVYLKTKMECLTLETPKLVKQ